VRYLEARPFTVETRLSRASRLAPTGTRTARSAIICACSTRVFGCVDVLAARPLRRELAAVRVVPALAVAGLRLVVRLAVVVGSCVPGVLVAMVSSLHSNRSDEGIGSQLIPNEISNMCL
jgi:hypothetical protein